MLGFNHSRKNTGSQFSLLFNLAPGGLDHPLAILAPGAGGGAEADDLRAQIAGALGAALIARDRAAAT